MATAKKTARSIEVRAPVVVKHSIACEHVARANDPNRNSVMCHITQQWEGGGRPEYWDHACEDLVRCDRILRKLIPQFGPVYLIACGDPFVALARSIISQQISVNTTEAIWGRLIAACPLIAPSCIMTLGQSRLLECGLSKRKSEYILDLAQNFTSGVLHIAAWPLMDDETVIGELTRIRGIGCWTAEMFLIFNLMRPNVLPLDDFGLIRAISLNYFSGEPVTRSEAREVAANWEPWRTVATWYMWRSLEPPKD
ncbi:DNA-3-methyladenine glycosylase family protein [Candidatus Vallotiella sp. (ex Adelges kitamiensis)]|uniref:DNA-3-methyladenine glycosylase family protein n=1 Tax=Candidatus Vallotiella sp. (ex Adelges kitamiensis) TaxID=2864217 RepID=UPI00403DED73